jgi:hypothetical protein
MNSYDDDQDESIDADAEYQRELVEREAEYDQEMHHPLPCTPTSHMWTYIGGGMTVGIYECATCRQIEIEPKGDI